MDDGSELDDLLAELSSGNERRAEAAVKALHRYGAAGVEGLQRLYQAQAGDTDGRVDARWWAVRALAEFDAPAARRALRQALQDPDAGVRQGAALGLRVNPDPEAAADLLPLLGDPDPLARRLAGDALVAAGSPAVPALLAALDELSPAAQVEAVRALALIGDPQAIPALFKRLDSESLMQEHWASEGLDRMGVGMAFFKP